MDMENSSDDICHDQKKLLTMLPKKHYFCYNLQAYFPKTQSDYRVEINYVLFHASLYYSKKEICPHPAHFFISYLFSE